MPAHTLLLASRQLARQSIGKPIELHDLQKALHLLVHFGLCAPTCFQAVRDIFPDGQVGEERVILENDADLALI